MFVIDTSITMTWCFEDEATAASDAVLDQLVQERAVVPAIWSLEVTNVLLVAERRRRLSEAQVSRFTELLSQLPIDTDDAPTDTTAVLALGRRHRLSSYDASYLALAERRGIALATLDGQLTMAARDAGVGLVVAL